MTDFKELRNKYNSEIQALEQQNEKIQKQISDLEEERREALKALVKKDENRIVWKITRVPHDSRHLAYIHAVYLSKETAAWYKDGEDAGSSDRVNWYYRVEKVTIDSISGYQLEKIQD